MSYTRGLIGLTIMFAMGCTAPELDEKSGEEATDQIEALSLDCADGDDAACEELENILSDRENTSDRCDEYVDMIYEECLENGGSEEDCRARAARAYEECDDWNEDEDEREDEREDEEQDEQQEDDWDEDTWSNRCDEYTTLIYEECLDDGGSEEECGGIAEEAYEECMDDAWEDEEQDEDERDEEREDD